MLLSRPQLDLSQRPLAPLLVEETLNLDLAVLQRPVQDYVKLDVVLVRISLPIAVHYLEAAAEFLLDQLILLDEGDGLVVAHTVHHWLWSQEAPPDEHVEETCREHRPELVVSNPDEIAKLLFLLPLVLP